MTILFMTLASFFIGYLVGNGVFQLENNLQAAISFGFAATLFSIWTLSALFKLIGIIEQNLLRSR
jgi:hypothetical protein